MGYEIVLSIFIPHHFFIATIIPVLAGVPPVRWMVNGTSCFLKCRMTGGTPPFLESSTLVHEWFYCQNPVFHYDCQRGSASWRLSAVLLDSFVPGLDYLIEPWGELPCKKLEPLELHEFPTKTNRCNTGLETVNFFLLFLASLNDLLFGSTVWFQCFILPLFRPKFRTQNFVRSYSNWSKYDHHPPKTSSIGKTSIFPCKKHNLCWVKPRYCWVKR